MRPLLGIDFRDRVRGTVEGELRVEPEKEGSVCYGNDDGTRGADRNTSS